MKIYTREYGVGYSEIAIRCLSPQTNDHIPAPSVDQIVIPDGNNTVFYIDATSWVKLVESLNQKYTSHTEALKKYEDGFTKDGEKYLLIAKKINQLDLNKLSNQELKNYYINYHEQLIRYSIYAWTSFILNNYISEKATKIIDNYIQKEKRGNEKQEIYNSLFHPPKRAAILELQHEAEKYKKLPLSIFEKIFRKYRWLSCLDIHNDPWTVEEFREHIKSFHKSPLQKSLPFTKIIRDLKIASPDLDYLLMAQRFVYIKDARDDYRRQGVYLALPFFREIGKRMGLIRKDVSYLQQDEITDFLDGKLKISTQLIAERKKGFVLYLDIHNKLICLTGKSIDKALKQFKLIIVKEKTKEITGMVASRGSAKGKVVIVKGVKDLHKVKGGDILVAVTTHPDFVPAMRKAGAIVTDEGGITSHAAIVSREFGIPCIVGTKNATKMLKNGDKIEVDAVEGKIKIL